MHTARQRTMITAEPTELPCMIISGVHVARVFWHHYADFAPKKFQNGRLKTNLNCREKEKKSLLLLIFIFSYFLAFFPQVFKVYRALQSCSSQYFTICILWAKMCQMVSLTFSISGHFNTPPKWCQGHVPLAPSCRPMDKVPLIVPTHGVLKRPPAAGYYRRDDVY